MLPYLIPDPKLGKAIESANQAKMNLCWTCHSCNTECPINIATNRLQPLKIVHMANLGLLDQLVRLPEIWYCLSCNRCNTICPMTVRPAAVISYLREQVARRKLVSYDTLCRFKDLFARFQQVRWHMASRCLNGRSTTVTASQWYQWLETPVKPAIGNVKYKDLFRGSNAFKTAAVDFKSQFCLTCSECSSTCPVFFKRSVFDPVWIFRMANFGLAEDLLKSPSLWLCIACQRCTNACGQEIKGHLLIGRLQELAVKEGYVDDDFPYRWKQADQALYPRLLEEIDSLFGFQRFNLSVANRKQQVRAG